MKRSSLVFVAVAVVGVSCRSHAQPQDHPPRPAASRADETLAIWNDIGNKLVHNSYTWGRAIEHSGEHFGQLVAYYRANNLVPPESRPRKGN